MSASAKLPPHLQKYIIDQEDKVYTPVEQAVWRFCLRQLRSFLSKHAHPSYLSGLEKTGIQIERIPRISEISEKLSHFGWRAKPVSGFIPPAAFMELQARNVLPIAADMRSLDHLLYTPAPDIVHEAAGHAPMLAEPEFADYLRRYAAVASKALISREDMEVYKAIRDLSDLKENPSSTPGQITAAEKRLALVNAQVSHISEATLLSRMNWWTAEYGLVGTLQDPKIYGAGLLSSVGESRWCLSDKVKKIPLTLECIDRSYDITEPQPQLYVTPDFKNLTTVLEQLADRMAFRLGGLVGVKRAIQAETVNTVELNSGLQISGKCVEVLGDCAYLRFEGPCQLSVKGQQLPGHDQKYHAQGFGTAVGFLRAFPSKSPSALSESEWAQLGASKPGDQVRLEYSSGVIVTGRFKDRLVREGQSVLLSLTDARAELQGRVLFDPSWGIYDLGLSSAVPSVFGGPADREAYGEVDDFVAARVPEAKISDEERLRHRAYAQVRQWRESGLNGAALEKSLNDLAADFRRQFPNDWLLILEMYELSHAPHFKTELEEMMRHLPDQADVIRDGLLLA